MLNLILIPFLLSILNLDPQPTVGYKIQGDFIGDGQKEFAFLVQTKKGKGNPVEDGTPDEYEIHFSTNKIAPIKIGCCDARLINEGDLANEGMDDLSIFQAPMNGCAYDMKTYHYKNGKWQELIEPFLVPTGCDYLTDDELQQRIFKENGIIYYYDNDVTDENFKLIKKRAILK